MVIKGNPIGGVGRGGQGAAGQVSVAHDMSGLGSARSGRLKQPPGIGGGNAPGGSPSGCADDQVAKCSGSIRGERAQSVGGGGVAGNGGADVSAMAAAVRE